MSILLLPGGGIILSMIICPIAGWKLREPASTPELGTSSRYPRPAGDTDLQNRFAALRIGRFIVIF
jgi:hypothetical protein